MPPLEDEDEDQGTSSGSGRGVSAEVLSDRDSLSGRAVLSAGEGERDNEKGFVCRDLKLEIGWQDGERLAR